MNFQITNNANCKLSYTPCYRYVNQFYMNINFMTDEMRNKLVIDPQKNAEKLVRMKKAIKATADAYKQIGYYQVGKDIEDILRC